MGYIGKNKEQVEIITKLTVDGKIKLLKNGTDLIKYFRVGDSDANYLVSDTLPIGSVPTNGSSDSSVVSNVSIESIINLDNTNSKYKTISSDSINVIDNIITVPYKTIKSGGEKIKINDPTKGNLFKSFGLPITTNEKIQFLTTNGNGGYFNTVLSDINVDEILIIPINEFDNFIDGSDIKVTLGMVNDEVWDLYSTYSGQIEITENKMSDSHPIVSRVIKNGALLFCDNIKKPSIDKSWSSGHNTFKPFKNGGKIKYNFTNDRAVGFVTLDSGFVVITNKEIVDNFKESVEVSFKSYTDEVFQTINVNLGRNEFFISNNSTFSIGDNVRITEFELLDKDFKVIAYAKLSKQLVKRKHEQLSINIKLMV